MVRVGFPESPPSAGRLANSGDRRLAGISNVGLSAGQFSTYAYSTTPENFISAITETSNSAAVYPSALTQAASYNTLNQLTDLSGQTLSFDAVGNLLSDGQRSYGWDAENRLIGITYPGQSGKQTAFAYDGLSRRTAITSTPAGGSATTTCGAAAVSARRETRATPRPAAATPKASSFRACRRSPTITGLTRSARREGCLPAPRARRPMATPIKSVGIVCDHPALTAPGWGCFRDGCLPCGENPHPALRADLSRMWER